MKPESCPIDKIKGQLRIGADECDDRECPYWLRAAEHQGEVVGTCAYSALHILGIFVISLANAYAESKRQV